MKSSFQKMYNEQQSPLKMTSLFQVWKQMSEEALNVAKVLNHRSWKRGGWKCLAMAAWYVHQENNMTITMIIQTAKVIGTLNLTASSTLLICPPVHFQKKHYLLWWTTIYASMGWVLFSSGLQPLCSQVVKPGPWIERQIKSQSRIRQNIPMDRTLKEDECGQDQVKMTDWKTTLHESIN